jgi:hypothetical protein
MQGSGVRRLGQWGLCLGNRHAAGEQQRNQNVAPIFFDQAAGWVGLGAQRIYPGSGVQVGRRVGVRLGCAAGVGVFAGEPFVPGAGLGTEVTNASGG